MAAIKGFIEIMCCSHGHEETHHSGKSHLINIQHIIEVEETVHNKTRFRCNGTWIETELSFAQFTNLIKVAT